MSINHTNNQHEECGVLSNHFNNMLNFIKQRYNSLVADQRFVEILSGSIWALLGRIVATCLGLIFNIIVARQYGAEIVGIVAMINSFLMLTTIFTVFGTPTSILRLIPEHLTKYSASSAFNVYRKTQTLVIGFSFVIGTGLFLSADLIAGHLLSKPALSFYFAFASLFIVFKSIMLLNTQAIRGLRLIKLFALAQVFPQGITLLFLAVIGSYWAAKDVPLYAMLLSLCVTGFTGLLIMDVAFKRKMQTNDRIGPVDYRKILSISLPMLFTSMAVFLIGQTGVILLSRFMSEADVGYYAIAVKLATLTTFLFSAVESMAAPKFSELYYENKVDELFKVAKKSTKLIFFSTVPILVFLLAFGKPILSFVFGQEFSIAYNSMALLVIGQFINSISGSTGIFMNMTGNQKIFSFIMFITTIFNVTLNLKLIPIFGINGAAFAGMISLCIWNGITLVYMKSKYGKTTCYLPFL